MENWRYILIRNGDSKTVNFKVEGFKNKKVKFTGGGNLISINNNILTAKKNKSILKKDDESITVKATIYNGSEYVCEYDITCFVGDTKNMFVPVTGVIAYSNYNSKKRIGSSFSFKGDTKIVAEIVPKEATNHKINAISNNKNILQITSINGGEIGLHAVSSGPAKLTIQAGFTNGNGTKADIINKTIYVNVQANPVKDIIIYSNYGQRKQAPKSFTIDKNTTLVAEIFPKNAGDHTIDVNSSNPSIISVSKSKQGGEIYLKPNAVGGPVLITVTAGNVTKKHYVTVSKNATATVNANLTPKEPNKASSPAKPKVSTKKLVTKVDINVKNLNLQKHKSFDLLKATVSPSDASEKGVVWSTSKKSVATVNKTTGKVTAQNYGKAKIYATAVDGSNKKAVCNVSVWVPVTWIKLNATNITLKNGKTKKLSGVPYPTIARFGKSKYITWTSSNSSVASVNRTTGLVTANSKGHATIYAKTPDGYKNKCKVTVTQPVKYITISKSGISVKKGESYKLKAKVHPSNANCKDIKWKTENSYYATVKSGKVTGEHVGNGRVFAYVKDSINGNKVHKAYCSVAIKPVKVKSVIITNSVTLNIGQSIKLGRKVYPSNASNPKLRWKSNKPSYVSVNSSSGKVTAHKAGGGIIVITATSTDGTNKKAFCHVRVRVKKQSTNSGYNSSTKQRNRGSVSW